MQETTVLIAGAGPTGLALALWLTKIGIGVRIIDKTARPGTTSRATVLHARNLELYHQMGIDQIAIDRGIEFKAANMWVGGKRVAHLPFGMPGAEISPYPYILIFPQDLHEAMLIEQLEKRNVFVERNTELLSFEDTGAGIIAQLQKTSGKETCTARYLAGCDGAHSVVRHQLGIGFPGAQYENIFYVADLKVKGPLANGEMNAALDKADFLIVFPMKGEGRVRLVGAIKPGAGDRKDFTWEDVSDGIVKRMDLQVEEIHWFSTYHVHHRVAAQFRVGNAFLLGDAGHIHSPVGGQGMNTGIGDAINLAWKIGAVVNSKAPDKLLDTYEQERKRFAQKLVASTDRAFSFVDQRGWLATFVRTRIAPPMLRLLFRFAAFRRLMFKTVSQTQIEYRPSDLSKGSVGGVKAGDRLPWLPLGHMDNYAPLTSMNWQVHCYGSLPPAIRDLCMARGVEHHEFPWNAQALALGFLQDVTYVVRPDGYVGFVGMEGVEGYFQDWGIG